MPISKQALFQAFESGKPFMGFRVVNQIQREDGSNLSYNVTGVNLYGVTETRYMRVVDEPTPDLGLVPAMASSFEFGFRCAEKGLNLQAAMQRFNQSMRS